jgi:hypothetical protein
MIFLHCRINILETKVSRSVGTHIIKETERVTNANSLEAKRGDTNHRDLTDGP